MCLHTQYHRQTAALRYLEFLVMNCKSEVKIQQYICKECIPIMYFHQPEIISQLLLQFLGFHDNEEPCRGLLSYGTIESGRCVLFRINTCLRCYPVYGGNVHLRNIHA